jgi:transcription initiation factor TFIIA small subunit
MQGVSLELYRKCTLGECLVDSLDQLIRNGQITPQLAIRVLSQYDKSMTDALQLRIKTKFVIKGHLNTYNFCDDVWTFVLDTPAVKLSDQYSGSLEKQGLIENGLLTKADRVKIIACNGTK